VLCREAERQLVADSENFGPCQRRRPVFGAEQAVPLDLRRARTSFTRHYVSAADALQVRRDDSTASIMFPQYLRPGSLAYARASMWAAVHRSDRILTVSAASKRDILRLFDVPPEKVVVVYNAIDEHFTRRPRGNLARARRYQLDDPFILYAGNIKPLEPRANYRSLSPAERSASG
jgi:glycosyltransferase involved in cell wall biosynthesis